ncbi:putative Pentatricopeptide repeat (PPR) superfamily protein [Hibiscus syriacus]|uniref:Pentatricopeptide repeat (PPR) superfamily protein n=1 Tax=Hibiscus syriacus TaxID=106335 RepID=A0A6A2Z568_HIBSY|nr:putative Pentatricopeptide repeat (PPR) superfamily protein [Hibiscus syriacus]
MVPEAIGSLLHRCSKTKAFRSGLSLHAAIFKVGMQADVIVSNHILNIYVKCGRINFARQLFDEMSERTLISWFAMISGYDQAAIPLSALDLFFQMRIAPNEYIFSCAISACSSLTLLGEGQQIHAQSFKSEYASVSFVSNSLIQMYMKCGFIENQQAEKGFQVFKHMHQGGLLPNHFTFVGFLGSCADSNALHRGWHCICQIIKHRLDSTAFIAFGEMFNAYHMRPDDFTFSTVLSASVAHASLSFGKQIHAHLIRTRPNQDVGVNNALTNMYAKCGSIAYAYNVFNRMPHRNLVSWNTIIVAFGNHGIGSRAVEHFEQLRANGLEPDCVTFVGLLMACNHAGMVDDMPETQGIAPDIEHFSCLIDMLGRAGGLNKAEDYMRRFAFGEDVVLLGSLLSACRLHGDVTMGERLAKRLLKHEGVSTSPYVLLSSLYASDEIVGWCSRGEKEDEGEWTEEGSWL